MRYNKKGGDYNSITTKSFSDAMKLNLGKSYLIPEKLSHCGGVVNKSNLGAATIRNQSGGNRGHAYSKFNHGGASSYGFTKQGAGLAHVLRGTYPAYSEIPRSQCGGRRRRRRKTKKRRRKRKTKRRTRKSRKKKRKTKKKTKKRRRRRRRKTRGGAYKQYMSNVPNRVSYNTPNPGPMPWATGPGSFKRVEQIY